MDSDLLEQIEAAIAGRQSLREGAEVRFLCPAHDDSNPSARWNPGKRVWFCDVCGVGGGALDLARSLELIEPTSDGAGLSLAELADARGLPVSLLRSFGMSEGVNGAERIKCVDIPYLDARSETVSVRKRLSLNGSRRFVWRRGDKAIPYGLWLLDSARSLGLVVLVEGETDTITLYHAGIGALGMPGAATWKEQYRSHLQDFDEVYVWYEPDRGGDTLFSKVIADVPDVRVIEAPQGIKDPNALWLSLGCDVPRFIARMGQLFEKARPASQIRAEAMGAEARKLLAQAGPLLQSPDLLDQVRLAIRATGYAGDTTAPMLVYISLTSRHQDRPLNLALIAQSAAGKNRAVDAALCLVPPEAYYIEKAGSPRALIYADEDFEHRIVVVAEADSIPEDGSAASAIRSLAADSYMAYEVVEKDPASGGFTTRHVEKKGPTGLITTYTRPLSEQLNTRVLTVTIRDTPDQTRAVLLAHAASVNGELSEPDLEPLIALQRWLDLAGEHHVAIPYAKALANLVPPNFVRMRRDFRQLLTVIQAIAVLYQRQRPRDPRGYVVATLDDYAMARELLVEVFTAAATGGVTREVRETVNALRSLHAKGEPVTIKGLGDQLGLNRSTAWHRVSRAIELGLIRNEESRKGQPAKLIPGDDLPEERPALPTVEELHLYVCEHDPETPSTVQPQPIDQVQDESAWAVENAVEPDVKPAIQPLLEPTSDSESHGKDEAVERLNVDLQGGYTPTDDADRVYALALAREAGFPRLLLRAAVSVPAGEDSWTRFAGKASQENIKTAIGLLEANGHASPAA